MKGRYSVRSTDEYFSKRREYPAVAISVREGSKSPAAELDLGDLWYL